jgi:gas vesicle protein
MSNDRTTSAMQVLGAFLLGAIMGGAAALLLTPKSGPELRAEIADRAKKTADQVREQVREKVSEVKTKIAKKTGEDE